VRLDPVASYIAGRPATVWCADSQAAFEAAEPRNIPSQATGFAHPTTAEAFLRPETCATLERWLHAPQRWKPSSIFADSLPVLVHESVHTRGVTDEHATECETLRRTAEVAIRWFGFRPHTQRIRQLLYLASFTTATQYVSDGCP
jgi:hypothetical protein